MYTWLYHRVIKSNQIKPFFFFTCQPLAPVGFLEGLDGMDVWKLINFDIIDPSHVISLQGLMGTLWIFTPCIFRSSIVKQTLNKQKIKYPGKLNLQIHQLIRLRSPVQTDTACSDHNVSRASWALPVYNQHDRVMYHEHTKLRGDTNHNNFKIHTWSAPKMMVPYLIKIM